MLNVWIAQPSALKAEAEAIKADSTVSAVEITGTKEESIHYAKLATARAGSTDGFFRTATVSSKAQILESIYVESMDDIAVLEKGGAVILGAWDWDGTRVYDLHPKLIDFMPIRKTYDPNGNETGSLAPIIEDVNLVYGQTPRDFA